MKINIQKCSNVTVIGRHNARHCKAVYNITTGDMYASVIDAANALGVSQSSVSFALDDDERRTCKGMRLCFQTKMMEHLEEIMEQNRIRSAKVAAYDTNAERRNAIARAQEKLNKHKANVEELRRKLDEEMVLMTDAESELRRLKNDN